MKTEYITGKQALLILNITTPQGLNKIVRTFGLKFKSQGVGRPNLYLKSDIVAHRKKHPSKNTSNSLVKSKKVKEKIVKKKTTHKKKIDEELLKLEEMPKEPSSKDQTKNEDNPKEKETIEITTINKPEKPTAPNDDVNPLNKLGQKEFERLREELIENGTYEDKDIGLLQAYCVSYQKYINAVNQSAEHLDTTMDDYGNLKLHPYFTVADKCLTQMTKLANILGLGVRSRIGIEVKKKKKESMFDILNTEEEF